MKQIAFRIIAVVLALLILVAKGLLPVATDVFAEPVNAGAPVFHFTPERDFL